MVCLRYVSLNNCFTQLLYPQMLGITANWICWINRWRNKACKSAPPPLSPQLHLVGSLCLARWELRGFPSFLDSWWIDCGPTKCSGKSKWNTIITHQGGMKRKGRSKITNLLPHFRAYVSRLVLGTPALSAEWFAPDKWGDKKEKGQSVT